MSNFTVDLDAEEAAFQEQVASIEKEWQQPRQSHLKRPYSAKSVAALRNTIPVTYASSLQGDKLWNILNKHAKNGTCEKTFGTTEPTVVSQMVKHQETVYVSGALCGLSEVQHPGCDHADYPWDTVPKVVEKIFKAQLWHDQRQKQFRMHHAKSDRAKLEAYDFMAPIVADGDMGFGGLTTTVKLAKSFVEAGVAMIHLDDLAIGLKKFTVGEGRTVVPTSEYLSRLSAVRMQFDVMGTNTLLMCRCDTDRSQFITSTIDARDHEYIIGATQDIEPLVEAVVQGMADGKTYLEARDAWKSRAGLMTFDEAVRQKANDQQYEEYTSKATAFGTALKDRRRIAKEVLAEEVYFDWDLPRSKEGQYMWRPSVKTIVERAVLAAPLGDMTWARMDAPVWKDIVEFHTEVRKVYPDRLFAFGFTGMYDYEKAGFSPEKIRSFSNDMAALGIVWQVQPIWAVGGLNIAAERFAREWQKDGIAGYIETISKPSRVPPVVDGFHKPSYAGTYLADAFFAAVAGHEIAP
ncbi:isocitrate lyase [Dactylonectria macrodidyma]|uniref:Isocitrate lyase n=1 Tax=Dactylonectria macrodidyma TaxID=307937 RepID=A0A9P9FX05_9HYPO|nr:isocitrate lyase [Dactylonectria macrodidyma]